MTISPPQDTGSEIRIPEVTCWGGKPAKGEVIGLGSVTTVGRELCAEEWELGESVVRVRLALLYVVFLKALELQGHSHDVYCLKREDYAFYAGDVQLWRETLMEAETIYIRFGGFKGGKKGKGQYCEDEQGG